MFEVGKSYYKTRKNLVFVCLSVKDGFVELIGPSGALSTVFTFHRDQFKLLKD